MENIPRRLRYVALIQIPRETALAIARDALQTVTEADMVEFYLQAGNWRWRITHLIPKFGCVWTKVQLEHFVGVTTMLSQEEFLARHGINCPNCGSQNMEETSQGYTAYSTAWQHQKCLDCGATWDADYRLSGYSKLTLTPKAPS